MDVIDWARNIPVHDLSDGRGLCRVIFAEDFLNALKDLPSAQPEIIRCKDCKHRHEAECPMYHEEDIEWDDDGYIERETIYHDCTEDDGYCDRGERRTDATD